ncbi:hypothetical protein [Paenibacillus marinisediminis]
MRAAAIIFFTAALLLVGCSDTKGMEEQNAELQSQIEQMKDTTTKLTEELKEKEAAIARYEQEKVRLENQIQALNSGVSTPSFNVFEEKLLSDPVMLTPRTMTMSKIKEVMGQPLNEEVTEYLHGGGNLHTLHFDGMKVEYNVDGDNEYLRWYELTKPLFVMNRGITVGSTRDEVIDAYGKEYYNFFENDKQISMGEKTGISFKLMNGKVSEIRVWFAYE